MSSPPCWIRLTKYFSLASIVRFTSMAVILFPLEWVKTKNTHFLTFLDLCYPRKIKFIYFIYIFLVTKSRSEWYLLFIYFLDSRNADQGCYDKLNTEALGYGTCDPASNSSCSSGKLNKRSNLIKLCNNISQSTNRIKWYLLGYSTSIYILMYNHPMSHRSHSSHTQGKLFVSYFLCSDVLCGQLQCLSSKTTPVVDYGQTYTKLTLEDSTQCRYLW
jgi:hypothetical protein